MEIIIIGASQLGIHLAMQFSSSGNNVTLIEKDESKIDLLRDLDIAYEMASGTDIALLKELSEKNPDLLVACSNIDERNLVICALAKSVGFKQTLARLRPSLNSKDIKNLFLTDHVVCPDLLASIEFLNSLTLHGVLSLSHFAHGKIQMRRIAISDNWQQGEKTLTELDIPKDILVALIHRKVSQQNSSSKINDFELIFPEGNTSILPGDEVILIGKTDAMKNAMIFFQQDALKVKRVMIYGLSSLGNQLCHQLKQERIEFTIITDKKQPKINIRHPYHYQKSIDKSFLRSLHAQEYDQFIAVSEDDQDNLCACLLAQDIGIKSTGTALTNNVLSDICRARGINLIVSPHELASSAIMALAAGRSITQMTSLYNHNVEIMQLHLSKNSALIGRCLQDIRSLLPQEFILGAIERNDQATVATGQSILQEGDNIVVITQPSHIDKLRSLI